MSDEVKYMKFVDIDDRKHKIDVKSIYNISAYKYHRRFYVPETKIVIKNKVYNGTRIDYNYSSFSSPYTGRCENYESIFVLEDPKKVLSRYLDLVEVRKSKVENSFGISKAAVVETWDEEPKCEFNEKRTKCEGYD